MVDAGDAAPDFTAPLVDDGDVQPFTFSDRDAGGPAVLAFFPGAFTSVCRAEMSTWQDRLAELDAAGATIYGVSVDTPFALGEFAEANDITYPMVSDTNKRIIGAYGVEMNFDDLGYHGVAKRAVFVVDGDDQITYAWVSDDPGVEPDYDEVIAAVEDA